MLVGSAVAALWGLDSAREVAVLLATIGGTAAAFPADVTDEQDVARLSDAIAAQLGPVDVLVLNAAFQMTYESVEEVPDDEWDRTVATNLSAFFHMTKAALPHMPEGSSIIGSSSVNSDSPSPNLFPYAMTKAGIANMCASLAQMLGPRGIRVNSVAPGPVWTPLNPAARRPPPPLARHDRQPPRPRPPPPGRRRGLRRRAAAASALAAGAVPRGSQARAAGLS